MSAEWDTLKNDGIRKMKDPEVKEMRLIGKYED